MGLVLGGLLAGGCAVETGSPEEIAAADERDESVAESSQAITVCERTHNHGGDLFPGSYDVILGCDCGAGRVRDHFDVWNVGHGSCSALGWASTDVRDCRVRVRINRSGGFANGTCHVRADAVPETNGRSCLSRCGQRAPGGCWCDTACTRYGDCCPDRDAVCR
jgi:hypothetical protein